MLAAADCAVMLLDAAKGVEPQTLRLFEVARARNIPLITFVNKYDRPGIDPLEMIDHIESVLGLHAGRGDVAGRHPRRFPRRRRPRARGTFHRFTRTAGGATRAPEELMSAAAGGRARGRRLDDAADELELLDGAGGTLDDGRLRSAAARRPSSSARPCRTSASGCCSTRCCGSRPRRSRATTSTATPRAVEAPFSGLVFKVQANMDPRHRDRVAFLRVCSGRFERGMRVINARSGKPFTLAHAHEVFGDDRVVLDEAFPGDVVGVINAARPARRRHAVPRRAGRLPADPDARARALRHRPKPRRDAPQAVSPRPRAARRGGRRAPARRDPGADPAPVLAAVGPLQFEVAVARLQHEFGVEVGLDPTNWTLARRTDDSGRRGPARKPPRRRPLPLRRHLHGALHERLHAQPLRGPAPRRAARADAHALSRLRGRAGSRSQSPSAFPGSAQPRDRSCSHRRADGPPRTPKESQMSRIRRVAAAASAALLVGAGGFGAAQPATTSSSSTAQRRAPSSRRHGRGPTSARACRDRRSASRARSSRTRSIRPGPLGGQPSRNRSADLRGAGWRDRRRSDDPRRTTCQCAGERGSLAARTRFRASPSGDRLVTIRGKKRACRRSRNRRTPAPRPRQPPRNHGALA